MPDIEQAKVYVQEFPHGLHTARVYAILGSFYDDLAKVIAALIENEKENKDYKYDCFSSYLTKEPYKIQLDEAKALAIENLEKAVALTPVGEYREALRQEMADVKNGETYAWHWCAD